MLFFCCCFVFLFKTRIERRDISYLKFVANVALSALLSKLHGATGDKKAIPFEEQIFTIIKCASVHRRKSNRNFPKSNRIRFDGSVWPTAAQKKAFQMIVMMIIIFFVLKMMIVYTALKLSVCVVCVYSLYICEMERLLLISCSCYIAVQLLSKPIYMYAFLCSE